MLSDLSTLDLATLNAAQAAIVTALRDQCCLWEQQSADAAAEGKYSNALTLENWAFAADLLASKVSHECFALFSRSVDARINRMGASRSVENQWLDALAIEVASAQSEPQGVCG